MTTEFQPNNWRPIMATKIHERDTSMLVNADGEQREFYLRGGCCWPVLRPGHDAMEGFLLLAGVDCETKKVIVFEQPYIPMGRKPKFAKVRGQAAFDVAAVGKGPPPMNAKTVMRLACFAGLIEMIAYECWVRVEQVTAQQATKFLTGSGRWPGGRAAKKAATMAECRRRGWPVKNDNEADAIAIALLAESVIYPQAARTRAAGPLFVESDLTAAKSRA